MKSKAAVWQKGPQKSGVLTAPGFKLRADSLAPFPSLSRVSAFDDYSHWTKCRLQISQVVLKARQKYATALHRTCAQVSSQDFQSVFAR